jgi:2,3-bisphosphoglycerate-independent phosphoglycerate mutase
MDRDNRWDRVQQAYDMLTEAKADYRFDNAVEGLNAAYQRDENDEFVSASIIQSDTQPSATINDDDVVIFMNFRADRAREITRAFVDTDFSGFNRNSVPKLASFVTTTEYAADIDTANAFPPEKVSNSFGELMEAHNKKQLRIAETEKYAHVTFFFSGGREALYEGEDRILIPSPNVATYDLQPEMSAPEVTEKLVAAITSGEYDTIICNYANGDMVGHTGNYEAALKAAEAIDESVRRVSEAILSVDGDCLITADHGNCEQMLDYDSGQAHTQHTTELVPFIYVGNKSVSMQQEGGKLADVAPTLLALLNMDQPAEMTGNSLVTLN